MDITVTLPVSSSASATFYIPVPSTCTIQRAMAALSADIGDAKTITLYKGSTDVGVLTTPTDTAVGEVLTMVADSTDGKLKFDEDNPIKVTVGQGAAAGTAVLTITLDQFARTTA